MIRFVKSVATTFLALIGIIYCSSWRFSGGALKKFITNSYIIKKICFKLHLSLNLL